MTSHAMGGGKAAILFQEVERRVSVCFETTESEWVFRVSDGQVAECLGLVTVVSVRKYLLPLFLTVSEVKISVVVLQVYLALLIQNAK